MADWTTPKGSGKSQSASLLLSPPGSGYSFDPLGGSSLLMPVPQTEATVFQTEEGEADTFIGQQDPKPFTYFSQQQHPSHPPSSHQNQSAVDPFANLGGEVRSNLHAPLRQVETIQQQHQPSTPPTLAPFSSPSSTTATTATTYQQQPLRDVNMQQTSSVSSPHPIPTISPYKPVHPHWFFCKEVEKKLVWTPFSLIDSLHVEEVYTNAVKNQSGDGEHPDVVVSTDGGRYDVHLFSRVRCPVYWEEEPTVVRRCSWFYRGEGEKRFVPYEEHFAEKLEEEYKTALMTNTWHRRLEFPGGETIIIHNPSVVVHFQAANLNEEWDTTGLPEGQLKPRVVKRGVEEFDNIEDGEPMQTDHLIFVVHGIGGFCDLKFRTVTEVVDDFRSLSNQLLHTHFREHLEKGTVGRIEFLPISWHSMLHGDATGIDTKLQPITLKSIPKLRYFANDTILDVLFYTSPVYCQTITNQVGSEINRMYQLFLERNPTFSGKVSVVGHSLGSVILFDILLHQRKQESEEEQQEQQHSEPTSRDVSPTSELPNDDEDLPKEEELPEEEIEKLNSTLVDLGLEEYRPIFEKEKIDMDSLMMCEENDLKDLGIPLGPRKKIVSYLEKKKLELAHKALGETKKKEDALKDMAQREEESKQEKRKKSMSTVNYVIGLAGTGQPFVTYPKLDFEPSCFFALGSPIAMFLTVRGLTTIEKDFEFPTCPAFYNIFHPFDPIAYRMEPFIDNGFELKPILVPHHKGRKRMHLEIRESLTRVGNDFKHMVIDSIRSTWNSIHDFARAHRSLTAQVEEEVDKFTAEQLAKEDDESDGESTISQSVTDLTMDESEVKIGKLNRGRRFDYVLQEKPIESFNEYLFALQSHMCYWESEDTVLLVLKEVYGSMGIKPTRQASRPDVSRTSTQRLKASPSLPLYPPPSSFPLDPRRRVDFGQGGTVPSNNVPPNALPNMQPNVPPQTQNQPFSQGYGQTIQTNQLSFQTSYQTPPGLGMDPTLPPILPTGPVGPPPLAGFVRQTSAVKK